MFKLIEIVALALLVAVHWNEIVSMVTSIF